MKKKWLATFYLILLCAATILSLYTPQTTDAKEEIVIPHEAIRLRILADSDADADQNLKRKVRDRVNQEITLWVEDLTSLKDARKVIQSRLPEIQQIAEEVVASEQMTQSVNVEFGRVKFPTKLYGQFLYPAGEYEAILITLGKGEGANWWCVLYPPLCFLDFSNGEATSPGFEDKKGKVADKDKKDKEKQKSAPDKDQPQKPGEELQAAKTADVQPEQMGAPAQVNVTEETAAIEEVKEATAEAAPPTAVPIQEAAAAEANADPVTETTATESDSEDLKSVDEASGGNDTASVNKVPAKNFEEEEPVETAKVKKEKSKPPVYEAGEEEVEVRFFVVDIWNKLFD
ncbi:stage II sporulation protein R [Mesobacillus zeae]|uniref:Stage II sporulation protein R n=1 Tax=Mesobacillus zeae TaxID=1917180 RepID=A0A398BDJ4_9BACI|nr:stage II sporulation protein R [Mesobacillus zeae]RID86888.1 stage II sporulation protein R [Mesobacillus zeae]